ncbi:hypothetical protein B0H11DRAFT_2435025 [Mycena galericulata]|nr:hypothetical protein B0H11DRAFT_2435025 [Mycena galericulata]
MRPRVQLAVDAEDVIAPREENMSEKSGTHRSGSCNTRSLVITMHIEPRCFRSKRPTRGLPQALRTRHKILSLRWSLAANSNHPSSWKILSSRRTLYTAHGLRHEAADSGCLKDCLDSPQNQRPENCQALHLAAENRDPDLASLLPDHGAPIDRTFGDLPPRDGVAPRMRTQASRVDLLLSRHAEGWNVLPAATVAGAALQAGVCTHDTGGAPAGVEEEEWDEAELELDWEVDEEMPTHLQNGKSRHRGSSYQNGPRLVKCWTVEIPSSGFGRWRVSCSSTSGRRGPEGVGSGRRRRFDRRDGDFLFEQRWRPRRARRVESSRCDLDERKTRQFGLKQGFETDLIRNRECTQPTRGVARNVLLQLGLELLGPGALAFAGKKSTRDHPPVDSSRRAAARVSGVANGLYNGRVDGVLVLRARGIGGQEDDVVGREGADELSRRKGVMRKGKEKRLTSESRWCGGAARTKVAVGERIVGSVWRARACGAGSGQRGVGWGAEREEAVVWL